MKSILTLLTLLFTLISNAQQYPAPPGGNLPPSPDPNGMPICRIACFAGCSPISPVCQEKSLGVIEQSFENEYLPEYHENQSLLTETFLKIISNNELTMIEVSSQGISQIKFDFDTGHLVYINKYNNEIFNQEYFFNPLESKYSELSIDLEAQIYVGKKYSFEKGGCGAKRSAVFAAAQNLSDAVASGNSVEISLAQNAYYDTYQSWLDCVYRAQ
jgi:hypothetical protein